MRNIFFTFCLLIAASLSITDITRAESPASEHIKDLNLIQSYFKKRFPEVPFEDFANGVYALDSTARENWEALEEFPPYEVHIDSGEEYWHNNSAIYSKCFPSGPSIKHNYPSWDDKLNTVITLPYAINLCRQSHELDELDYMGMEMNSLVAYIAYQSRGEIINIRIPNENALEAYQKGKKFYFTRRGQLNFACFHCHFDNAGKKLRTESLGPALGQTTGWPTYRNKWGALGPLHKRYIGCNKQVRAAPFEAQSEIYRNLEYFHTHMNNGLAINGPAVRR
ncbi:MAG: sulfur oxidation c-type cytochrome SoxA [Gammaproteobacteria bacterium]